MVAVQLHPARPAGRTRAACRGRTADMFAEDRVGQARAVAICADLPGAPPSASATPRPPSWWRTRSPACEEGSTRGATELGLSLRDADRMSEFDPIAVEAQMVAYPCAS